MKKYNILDNFKSFFLLNLITLALFFSLVTSNIALAMSVKNSLYIPFSSKLAKKEIMSTIKKSAFVIDHLSDNGVEIYGDDSLVPYLNEKKLFYFKNSIFQNNSYRSALLGYPKFKQSTKIIKNLVRKYSDIMQLESIGKSVQGRDIWAVKISDNPTVDEIEPEFKYIANMHGNEIVGRELMIKLIDYIGKNYVSNSKINHLVNNSEIYIIPSMNPDGAEAQRRGNANHSDLNRDFPDFTTSDNINTINNRQKETSAIMKFQKARNFALSANFHGGSQVVNYPWDTTIDQFPMYNLIKNISEEYAKKIPYIYHSKAFEGGVTNGYDWYEVNGGMQDWSYFWHNDLQITVELSNDKWPPFSLVPFYFKQNRSSLIYFMNKVFSGAGFFVKDQDLKSKNGTVKITKIKENKNNNQEIMIGSFGFSHGEFYKILEDGIYNFDIVLENGKHYSKTIEVDFKYLEVSKSNYFEI